MEEARTRAVVENLSDFASMRVPRWSNVDQQEVAFPQALPCPQYCLSQKRLCSQAEQGERFAPKYSDTMAQGNDLMQTALEPEVCRSCSLLLPCL